MEHGDSVESRTSSQKQLRSSSHLQSFGALEASSVGGGPEWATSLLVPVASAGATGGEALSVSQTDREKKRGERELPSGETIPPRIGDKLRREIESEDGGAPICAKSPLPGRSNAAN